ncbi:MAG: hypothetical protein JNK04_12110 [Myxococcales bacterium]|nr:hypothetical protein [Myxococcales bacterium]
MQGGLADLDACATLREGAAQLLDAKGAAALARAVRAGRVEVADDGETWEMGARRVEAQRIALIVDAPSFLLIREDPAALAQVREAFASAVRSFETELAELGVFLRLDPTESSWQAIYRRAPAWVRPEPSAEEVQRAAVSVARAAGATAAAELLEGAELEVATFGDAEPLTRWLVRLGSAEYVRVDKDASLHASVERWVRAAAQSARGSVGEIALGVILPR